jgi:hypothetical protein
MFHRLFCAMLLGLSPILAGCASDDDTCDSCPPDPGYVAQTSPDNVLNKFQASYRARDINAYAELLAEDFRFFFDPATRNDLGIESWDAGQDSAATGALFESPVVTDITINLMYPAGDDTVTGAGRERWRHKRVTEVFLDVDVQPTGGELTTYRVENQTQDFYFRQGRTPADTLESSPTADDWYLVEWRDRGTSSTLTPGRLTASEATSWSGIKALVTN